MSVNYISLMIFSFGFKFGWYVFTQKIYFHDDNRGKLLVHIWSINYAFSVFFLNLNQTAISRSIV